MRSTSVNFLVLIAMTLSFVLPVQADTLGHLFTTEQQRNRLDYMRSQKIVVEKSVVAPEDVDEILEPEIEEEAVIKDSINIKGIVKRSDGKHSAWINDSNTYEGDLDTLYLNVGPEHISSDRVKIKMPDKETEIELRVGEAYDPNTDQIFEKRTN